MPTHRILLADESIGWWGWTEDPPPNSPTRMHLMSFTGDRIRIELETEGGVRSFRPVPRLPLSREADIAAEVSVMRPELEARWLDLVRGWGWVSIHGNTVTMYEGSDLAYTRKVPVVGIDIISMPSTTLAPLLWRS